MPANPITDIEILTQGLDTLNIAASEQQLQQLLSYAQLIEKWNKVYNLTAIKGSGDIIIRHLLDSLAIKPYIYQTHILDIGSGAGLPGIPLAIMLPQSEFTLLDSNSKKTRFMRQAVLELKLENVQVMHCRIENYVAKPGPETIVCRAFSSLSNMVQWTEKLMRPQTRLLAMKGRRSQQELDELPEWISVKKVNEITIPFLDAQRHLIELARSPAQANTKQEKPE